MKIRLLPLREHWKRAPEVLCRRGLVAAAGIYSRGDRQRKAYWLELAMLGRLLFRERKIKDLKDLGDLKDKTASRIVLAVL
jgi:hypothetical protein